MKAKIFVCVVSPNTYKMMATSTIGDSEKTLVECAMNYKPHAS